MTLDAANAILADLQTQRAAIIGRRGAIMDEMAHLGFAAHVEASAPAKAALAKLRTELGRLATEEISLDGAAREAGKRQAEAQRAASAVADAECQAAIGRLEAEHRALGREADNALAKLVATVGERHDLQGQMRRLGASRSGALSGVTDKRCVETALAQLGRPFEVIAPAMRLTFQEADARATPKQGAAA